MRFKEAIKDTNKSLKKALKGFSSEFREAVSFYKQAWSDFIYASKCLSVFMFCCLLMIFFPFLYIHAVIIRMVRK